MARLHTIASIAAQCGVSISVIHDRAAVRGIAGSRVGNVKIFNAAEARRLRAPGRRGRPRLKPRSKKPRSSG